MCNEDVTRCILESIPNDDNYKTTDEIETKYHEQVSFESNKQLNVVVGKDKPTKMKQQVKILKYKQISPNWFVFHVKKRNHNEILELY